MSLMLYVAVGQVQMYQLQEVMCMLSVPHTLRQHMHAHRRLYVPVKVSERQHSLLCKLALTGYPQTNKSSCLP